MSTSRFAQFSTFELRTLATDLRRVGAEPDLVAQIVDELERRRDVLRAERARQEGIAA